MARNNDILRRENENHNRTCQSHVGRQNPEESQGVLSGNEIKLAAGSLRGGIWGFRDSRRLPGQQLTKVVHFLNLRQLRLLVTICGGHIWCQLLWAFVISRVTVAMCERVGVTTITGI